MRNFYKKLGLVLLGITAIGSAFFLFDHHAQAQLGGGSGTLSPLPYRVKVSSNDTLGGYLNGKLVAGSGVTFTELNDGANETLSISSAGATGPITATSLTMNTSRVLGRTTAGVGAIEELTTVPFTMGGLGTNLTSVVVGNMFVADSTTTVRKIPNNNSSVAKFLYQSGNGSVVTTTAWQQVYWQYLGPDATHNSVAFFGTSGFPTSDNRFLFDNSLIKFSVGDIYDSNTNAKLIVDDSTGYVDLVSPYNFVQLGDPYFVNRGTGIIINANYDIIYEQVVNGNIYRGDYDSINLGFYENFDTANGSLTYQTSTYGGIFNLNTGNGNVYAGDLDGLINSVFSAVENSSSTIYLYGSGYFGTYLDFANRVYDLGEGNINVNATADTTNLYSKTTTIQHIKGATSAPTIAAGTGAGTTPTISIAGTDLAGAVSVTTGTTPAGTNATVATITFNRTFTTAPYVIITPANALTALLTGVTMVYVTSGTGTFSLISGTTALPAATALKWNYHVIE